MKKLLALVLVLALTFALAIPAAALVEVTANKTSPVIDGVRDEAYSGPTPIAAHHQKPDGTNSMDSATGNVWTAWDDGALYFYIEVNDKTPNHTEDGDRDNVEIMIDWLNGGATGEGGELTEQNEDGSWGYEPGTPDGYPFWQVRVFAGPTDDGDNDLGGANWYDVGWGGVEWGADAFADVCEYFNGPLDGSYRNGYVIEIKIGLPEGVSLSEGMVIPFDIQICDNINGAGTRDGQAFLAPSDANDMQWAVPSTLMGRLALGGAPAVAVPEVQEEAPAEAPAEAPEAVGGGDAAPEPPPVAPAPAPARPPSANTGDAGMIALAALMAAALTGFVILKKKAVR